METFYLGKKDDEGVTQKLYSFELLDCGVTVRVIKVPPRTSQDLEIQVARSLWANLVADGFKRIDVRVAIAASARMNDERQRRNNESAVRMGSVLYGGWHQYPED